MTALHGKPIVLHCASLSIAGTVPPSAETVADIAGWVSRTRTPWLGEHLSFITAEREIAGGLADEYAPGEPYNIGYTVSPVLNRESLDRIVYAVETAQERLDVPLLLENPPLYFALPGSDMTQAEFIAELCARTQVSLLLDLAHFYITSRTMGFDPIAELSLLPLGRVVEVHISGVNEQGSEYWDNHGIRAPEIELELLARVLEDAPVQAITLEYNWSVQFPTSVLLMEIDRARAVVVR
jgi:uncharacterized protein (UPF0276 family)